MMIMFSPRGRMGMDRRSSRCVTGPFWENAASATESGWMAVPPTIGSRIGVLKPPWRSERGGVVRQGAVEDAETRNRHIRSMALCQSYHWIMLRQYYRSVQRRFGEAGLTTLAQGIRRYGFYRGQFIRNRPETFEQGMSALSLLLNWDSGELAYASVDGSLRIEGTGTRATLTFSRVPGSDYFRQHDDLAPLALYWPNTLKGMAEGYDRSADVEVLGIPDDPDAPWSVVWTYAAGDENEHATPLEDVFGSVAKATAITRRVFGALAAFQMYVTRALIDEFDATGEEAAREALYNFGAERSQGMREQHLAEGKPINFSSLLKGVNERDPYGALFVFRGEVYVSDGLFIGDCVYCPAAEVWATEGAEGLALGYMYDMEVHRGLIEGYHPGGVVRWDALKTRGNPICRFRFSIPELVTDEERARLAKAPPGRRRPGATVPPT